MSKLVTQNHSALHEIAAEVPLDIIRSPKIQKVLKDMRQALEDYSVEGFNGVAIAAPQIGISLRIFLVHDTEHKKERKNIIPDLVAVNPKIIKLSKRKHVVGEGCLSVQDQYGAVSRSTHATLRAYDAEGNEFERGASGLLAQIFQHEVDHLDGILFVDKADEVWHKDDSHAQKLREAREE